MRTLCYLNEWKLFLMSKFIQYKLFVSISFIDVWKMNIDNLESTTSQVMFCGDWTSWEAWIASVLCNYSLRFIKKNLLSFTRLVHPTQLKPITFLPHNIQKRKWNVKVASKKIVSFHSTPDQYDLFRQLFLTHLLMESLSKAPSVLKLVGRFIFSGETFHIKKGATGKSCCFITVLSKTKI